MTGNPFLGIFLHAIGGLASASFYLPFRGVKKWSWESYWLVGGFFSWMVVPWVTAFITVPELLTVLREAPGESLWWSYFFGVLWGIGGLTFGLSMRYLGMSLGYAMALGFCAAFGTLIPPVFHGEFLEIVRSGPGKTILAGVALCLVGIAICGRAGVRKERELSEEEKKETIQEFHFARGVWVAVFAGIMSACMAFGIAAGAPIAETAVQHGTPSLWQNSAVFVVVLPGGFTTNLIWCAILNARKRSWRDYFDARRSPLGLNYAFCALAGLTWYLQFLFYGMGTTRMGKFDFSSWTLHMAFIIIFSNFWAIYLREWRGVSRPTKALVWAGILGLIVSTVVVGIGNYYASSP